MASPPNDPQGSNGSSEAERILADLRALRQSVVVAWQERAVILSREEQLQLTAEIKRTCEILTDLTAGGSGVAYATSVRFPLPCGEGREGPHRDHADPH